MRSSSWGGTSEKHLANFAVDLEFWGLVLTKMPKLAGIGAIVDDFTSPGYRDGWAGPRAAAAAVVPATKLTTQLGLNSNI